MDRQEPFLGLQLNAKYVFYQYVLAHFAATNHYIEEEPISDFGILFRAIATPLKSISHKRFPPDQAPNAYGPRLQIQQSCR